MVGTVGTVGVGVNRAGTATDSSPGEKSANDLSVRIQR